MKPKKYKPKDLVAVRERLSLSQRELAIYCGVHMQSVSRWERGVAEPTEMQRHLIDLLANLPNHAQNEQELKTALSKQDVKEWLSLVVHAHISRGV